MVWVGEWREWLTWSVLPRHMQEEEEEISSGTSCLGQGQGVNVSAASFSGCSGCALLAETMSATTHPGPPRVLQGVAGGAANFRVGANAVEMEREKCCGFGLGCY